MKIQTLRNATTLLSFGEHRLLIDPMLSEVGALPGFKMVGGGRRPNPLVPLPAGTPELLKEVTGVIVTHEHPDHLDVPAIRWMKEEQIPVWANPIDAPNLKRKGLTVHELRDGSLDMTVETIPSRHGRGLVGWLMGPVAGYYLAPKGEPSLYITGDSILTDTVLDAVDRLQPDILLAPAGAANMGVGGDILFSVDELVTLIQRTRGQVVLNHLEALDHCPTTRTALRERMQREGLANRVFVPEDGEVSSFEGAATTSPIHPPPTAVEPGFQKWLTAKFAGT